MITEDEFKDLTDSLEGVGHYGPSVKDMLTHIRDSNLKWVGLSVEYTSTSIGGEHKYWDKVKSVKAINFPKAGRFEKAIFEFVADPDKFSSLIKELGMLPTDLPVVFRRTSQTTVEAGEEIILAKDLK